MIQSVIPLESRVASFGRFEFSAQGIAGSVEAVKVRSVTDDIHNISIIAQYNPESVRTFAQTAKIISSVYQSDSKRNVLSTGRVGSNHVPGSRNRFTEYSA